MVPNNSKDQEERQKLIDGWSELYGRQISEEDLDEICYNLKGFFDILKEWDDEDKKEKKVKNKTND